MIPPISNIELIRNLNIYIIDDSRSFSMGIKAILSNFDCKVKCFQCSEEAIDVIFQEHPDIIITDLEMPKMSGLELIKKIREQNELSVIPILVLSSKDSQDQLVECLFYGADAFASKNSIQAVLLANIFALMRVAQLRKQVIAVKQFEAVKALIGTYKHDFGNTLTIMDGKINKLTTEFPAIIETDEYQSIKNAVKRFTVTLEKLSALREYKEEKYSPESSIVKI
ncbi:MAG: response regulator [Bacteriovoracaceae bacterium]|nr:response regulator [Bacteriovoracaceae bacterium]